MTLSQDTAMSREVVTEDDRTGLSVPTLRRAIADNLRYIQGKIPANASINDYYLALAYTVRDRLLNHWLRTRQIYLPLEVKMKGQIFQRSLYQGIRLRDLEYESCLH